MEEEKGPLTQEVEYLPFKQRVVGSSPARPTIRNSDFGMRNSDYFNSYPAIPNSNYREHFNEEFGFKDFFVIPHSEFRNLN